MSTTLRGGQRLDEPEMPGGQIVLQPPPELQDGEGAGGVLMNAIPMLGSLGSIVLVATMGGANKSRSFLAAGMFLFATLGFIIVQIDRHLRLVEPLSAPQCRAHASPVASPDEVASMIGAPLRVATATPGHGSRP